MPKWCPSLPTHADHLIWVESSAVPGRPFAVLIHLCVTRLLLQTSDRSYIPPRRPLPTLLRRRLSLPLRAASLCPWGLTPRGTVGFSRLPGSGILHLEVTAILWCLSLVELSFKERYHI